MRREEVEEKRRSWRSWPQIVALCDSWLTLEQRNRELEGEVESWQQAQSIFRQENLRLQADKAQLQSDLEQAQEEIGRLKEAVKVQTLQAIAWTHAEACVALNEGQDLHQVFVPGLLERFYREMEPPHAD